MNSRSLLLAKDMFPGKQKVDVKTVEGEKNYF